MCLSQAFIQRRSDNINKRFAKNKNREVGEIKIKKLLKLKGNNKLAKIKFFYKIFVNKWWFDVKILLLEKN